MQQKAQVANTFMTRPMGPVSLTMILWNYLITPLYMGIPRETVASMLPTVFAPG